MTFQQRLVETTGPVEQRLQELLSAQRQSQVPPRLLAAMRHAVLGQGKRFRPFLLIESARMLGAPAAEAVDAAAALELVHCYSLVHDDLPAMDNDELRRGLPTVWKAFDEWTAILAGDALLTLAFEVMGGDGVARDPEIRVALVSGLARAAGAAGMVGGQQLDLEAEKLGQPPQPAVAHVLSLQAMKTGALISFACEAGARLARASAAELTGVRRYGAALGIAFQIADDLLDVEGDAATVGKAVAKDANLGKATLVGLMGAAGARQRLADAVAEAEAALAPFGVAAAPLVQAAQFAARRRS